MSNFIVGLTGGIGSGKTTVADMFAALGVDIIDADVVAREVVKVNSPALITIVKHFGSSIILANGELDRNKLRSKIFANEKDKHWLNQLLHPLIRQLMTQQLEQATSPYCLLVAPLLIENKLTHLTNRVLVVDVDEASQLSRTLQRDNSSADTIKAIMASQVSRKLRLAAADNVIDNKHTDLSLVKSKVEALHQFYLGLVAQISR